MTNTEYTAEINKLRKARRAGGADWKPPQNPMLLPDGSEFRMEQRGEIWRGARFERDVQTSAWVGV